MGNSGLVSTGEVAIFDPACFIGDAEFGTLQYLGFRRGLCSSGKLIDLLSALVMSCGRSCV